MKTPLFLMSVAAASLLLPATLRAEDDPAAKIKAFTDAHAAKMEAFGKKMQGATREDQQEIYRNDYPDSSAAVAAITQIVQANPGEDASLDGIIWVVSNSRNGQVDAGLLAIIGEHHLDNEKMVDAILPLMRVSSPEVRALLVTASEQSKLKDVRGMATYALAIGIERDTSKQDEYIALIERLIKDHQDLEIRGRNIAKTAEGKLFAARNLDIGKKAPEIIGTDVDGREMKLSDYRGKVVVIDFWGDW
jgi:hypothetical protein